MTSAISSTMHTNVLMVHILSISGESFTLIERVSKQWRSFLTDLCKMTLTAYSKDPFLKRLVEQLHVQGLIPSQFSDAAVCAKTLSGMYRTVHTRFRDAYPIARQLIFDIIHFPEGYPDLPITFADGPMKRPIVEYNTTTLGDIWKFLDDRDLLLCASQLASKVYEGLEAQLEGCPYNDVRARIKVSLDEAKANALLLLPHRSTKDHIHRVRKWMLEYPQRKDRIRIIHFNCQSYGLTTLPLEIRNWKDITCLNIMYNNVRYITSEINSLSIQDLHLDFNPIMALPQGSVKESALKCISLAYTQLPTLPAWIKVCKQQSKIFRYVYCYSTSDSTNGGFHIASQNEESKQHDHRRPTILSHSRPRKRRHQAINPKT